MRIKQAHTRGLPTRQSRLPAWLMLLLLALLSQSCSLVTLINPDPASTLKPVHNIAKTRNDLLKLTEIDSVVRLNNRWLANQMKNTLLSEAESSEDFGFTALKVNFSNQLVSIEADIDALDGDGNVVSFSAGGEIQLSINYPYLSWSAHFDHLLIQDGDFLFEGKQYAKPATELTQQTLQRLNDTFSHDLTGAGHKNIALSIVPLGEIQVGAALRDLNNSPARHTEALRGFFITAASAQLIESDYTSFALDLVFVPGVSICSSDIVVSRADFAREIRSREPVKTSGDSLQADDIRYFFSEISGAKNDLTVIHYWYSNGKVTAVEELAVGASKRWRTWSTGGSGHTAGDRLTILVIEKETGCILLSRHVQLAGADPAEAPSEPVALRRDFKQLKEDFNQHISTFSSGKSKPPVVAIHTRRSFLKTAIEGSLADLTLKAEFDPDSAVTVSKEARLQAFDLSGISCETRDCPPAKICNTNISHCKRLRDTRNCTSCLFRNPLNNRCISVTTDPVCEAARSRQNARYEAERNACITDAETLKLECDYRNAQASRSCEIEAGFADNTCDSIKSSIDSLKPGMPLAYINSSAKPSGSLAVNFSNFRIEGDLEKIKLDISLTSNLKVTGVMNFSPADIARPLSTCIAAWSSPFTSRVTNTPYFSDLQSPMEYQDGTLVAAWSGFGLTFDTHPSPLESVLVGHPQMLANCKIGLTVDKVEQAVGGEESGYYRGQFELEIQPLPTKIYLAPASIHQGDIILSAAAELSATNVSYTIK